MGAKQGVCFVLPNCHLTFMLLVDGNIVRAVEYASRI